MAEAAPLIKWNALAAETRAALAGKLSGLYGWSVENEIFDALEPERQQALLLLMRRFQELSLWDTVRRITNVYGRGGVGMDFEAWPLLRATLRRRRNFTSLMAGHRNNQGGFREKRANAGPSLHVVMVAVERAQWAAHFDHYNPVQSLSSFWRHIYYESFRGKLPGWRDVGGPLLS